MVESNYAYRHNLEIQNRFSWYQVNSLLKEVGQTTLELGIEPTDIMHLGGTAHFYWCYQVFGPAAALNFRGVHDMDMVSFDQGGVQRVIDRLVGNPSSVAVGYDICRSKSLQDKKCLSLHLRNSNDPGLPKTFDLDIYESHNGAIRLNKRSISKHKVVFDTPVELGLQKQYGSVSVPSLRDGFIIKMDVVDFSNCGLRPKDMLDILVTLNLCQPMSIDPQSLFNALIEDYHDQEARFLQNESIAPKQKKTEIEGLRTSLVKKLTGLSNVLSIPPCLKDSMDLSNLLIPRGDILKRSLEVVNKVKRQLGE